MEHHRHCVCGAIMEQHRQHMCMGVERQTPRDSARATPRGSARATPRGSARATPRGSARGQKEQKRETLRRAKGEVCVILRFKAENIQKVKNACKLEKRVIENHNGRVVGIAEKVSVYEGDRWPSSPPLALLVLEFLSEKDAIFWFNSDRVFRQQDWPAPSDSIDVILLPMQYLPSSDANAFQLTELYNIRNSDEFQENYIDKVAPMLDRRNILHGVVATDEPLGLRTSWIRNRSFVVVNRATSIAQLSNLYNSADYYSLMQYRQCNCVTDTIMFEVTSKF